MVATDSGTAARTGTGTVIVMVNDLNDNTPVISGQPYDTSISEDATVGTTAFSILATDADASLNGYLTYAIASGDGGHFKIDPDTGILTTKSTLDRETIDSYQLVVEVQDNGSPALTATTTGTVTIQDINDNAPVFTQTFSFWVAENVDNGTFVGRVLATDADLNSNAAIQFTLIQTLQGHADYFDIDSGTGDVYTLNDLLDREDGDTYVLTIRAADGGTPTMYSDADVAIQISDENDHRPVCPDYTSQVSEDDSPGIILVNVTGTDQDINSNAQLVYSIDDVTASQYFSVDSSTGIVTLSQTVDRELTPSFQFVVKITDMGSSPQSTSCTISVSVGDINDNTPTFKQSFYSAEVGVDSASDFVILTIEAVDGDANANSVIMYQFAAISDEFKIDAYSGNWLRWAN